MSGPARSDPQARWLVRRLTASPLTAQRAAAIVALASLTFTIAAGLLAFAIDRDDFPSVGVSLWWAVQTVTTVGYGDAVPANAEGRVIGTAVMLLGVSAVAVVTAVIAAALVGAVKVRLADDALGDDHPLVTRIEEIAARLERIEAALEPPGDRGPGDPGS